jgi:aspartate racemase
MKKIGIVGGTAWVSTVEYYTMLCELGDRAGKQPEFAIESIDNARAQSYRGEPGDEASWEQFDAYHRTALQNVERAGAQVALLAANTPHHRFAAITEGIGIPIVNIIDAVADTCAQISVDRLLLLGTTLTMSSDPIRARYAQRGVEASVPPKDEHDAIAALIERLQRGEREGAQAQIADLATGHNAVALACTELPLAFPEESRSTHFARDGVTYLNTLAIHANAIFDHAR